VTVAPARPRPRTRLARAERREQIIDAAAVLLDGRDPNEVTFEEIADAAGVSRALLYNYFGDRHGLVEAMYLRAVEELDALLVAVRDAATDGHDLIERTVRAHLDFAAAKPMLYRYAAGLVRFPRFAEFQRARLGQYARSLGGGEMARILALGTGNATYQMVLGAADLDEFGRERACTLITAFIEGGFAGVREAGVLEPAGVAGS
jgi:AcrR family transcriptional regulator